LNSCENKFLFQVFFSFARKISQKKWPKKILANAGDFPNKVIPKFTRIY
jgi:hypothetical protein